MAPNYLRAAWDQVGIDRVPWEFLSCSWSLLSLASNEIFYFEIPNNHAPNLIFFFKKKNQSSMSLFHSACKLILENFKHDLIFMLIKLTKFQPAQPYSILHIYQFWRFSKPASLFFPALFFCRLKYSWAHFNLQSKETS